MNNQRIRVLGLKMFGVNAKNIKVPETIIKKKNIINFE